MRADTTTGTGESPAAGLDRPGLPWVRRGIDLLGSGRLAVGLLGFLSLLLLLYLLVPQFGPEEMESLDSWVRRHGAAGGALRVLGLTGIRHSWWLEGTLALVFINLLACMIRRIPLILFRCRFPDTPPPSLQGWTLRELDGPRLDVSEVERFLRRRRFRTRVSGDSVYGLRGRFAPLGHGIFHAGLLVLLAGGAYTALRPAPFRGTLGLGEGETFRLRDAPFLSTNDAPIAGLPDLRFDLERLSVSTEGETVRRFEARLSTAGEKEVALAINRPFRSGPYQVMAHGFGFMPGWAIVEGSGRMRKGAWVKLVPFPLQGEETFRIGPRTSRVDVQFFPDHAAGEEGDRTRSHEILNPMFRTRIVLRGETRFKGLLAPGERAPLEDGLEFFFLPEIRRYVLVDVIQERGHAVTFAGFAIVTLGLYLRYARIRKECLVQVGDRSHRVYGRSEILPELFREEMGRWAAELAAAGGRGGR